MLILKRAWKGLVSWAVIALYCGAIALVLGFLIGLFYKAYSITYHFWV